MLHVRKMHSFSPTVIRKYSEENEKSLDTSSDMSAKEEEELEDADKVRSTRLLPSQKRDLMVFPQLKLCPIR
jgi:hypothetical protein